MSTYSTNLALELIGTGEQAGVWGTTTNTNLGTLIEQAISGYVTQAVATGTDTTITIPNGATGVARNMYIELTGTGGTNTNLIVPANKKLYFIFNNSTGAVTVKVSGQTGVSVPQGKKVVLTSNGTDIVNGLNYIADFGSNSATITQLTATSATITNLTLTSLVISNLSIASANITTLTATNETISGNLTLSGGTANGVLYLNGSKVATSGSALYFNGTQFGVGTNSINAANTAEVTGDIANTWSVGATRFVGSRFSDGAGYELGIKTVMDTRETRLFAKAADTGGFVTIATGTTPSERLRVDASGNVGIGTASPTRKLQVATSAGQWGVENYSTGTKAVSVNSANNAVAPFGIQASAIDFLTGGSGSATMVLDASGNLGIGTASPSDILTLAGGASGSYGLTINNAKVGGGTKAIFQYDATNAIALVGGNTTNGLAFQTLTSGSLTTKATLDSSGNLGLGVTPSAWETANSVRAFQLNGGNVSSFSNAYIWVGQNWYRDSASAERYVNTAAATKYQQAFGAHSWFTAPSGTAGNTISFTQAMTLDASSNLSVGTTSNLLSAASRVTVSVNGASSSAIAFGVGDTRRGHIYVDGSETVFAAGQGGQSQVMTFQTNGSERARITSGGDFGIGTASPAYRLDTRTTGTNDIAWFSTSSGGGGRIAFSDGNSGTAASVPRIGANGNDMVFLTNTSGNSATERARISSGGAFSVNTTSSGAQMNVYHNGATVAGFVIRNTDTGSATQNAVLFERNTTIVGSITTTNAATAYVTSSDRRLKDNIIPADDAGSVIDSIEIVKHDWKVGGHVRYGVIAQDLHQVAPEAVQQGDDGDDIENPWGVDYSKLVPMLIKEVQSLRSRIAILEAK